MTEVIDVQEAAALVQDMHQFHYRAWDRMDNMERLARRLKDKKDSDKAGPLKEIDEVRTFFRDGVGPHFQMEEAKIYPLVKTLLPPRKRIAIAFMIKEHRAIWRHVMQLRDLLQAAREGGAGAQVEQAEPVGDVALQIVRLVRRHITKENMIYQTLEGIL
ncbi:MAG: hemerythrin domain-containing protein [Dehalococcoidia bacterium]|nr:hemerythrin domain-containing protein [Dehalococcoidia bacterium]